MKVFVCYRFILFLVANEVFTVKCNVNAKTGETGLRVCDEPSSVPPHSAVGCGTTWILIGGNTLYNVTGSPQSAPFALIHSSQL